MHCSCTMMSPSDILLKEEEGADVDGADRDGAEREGGVAKFVYRDLNCASLPLTVAMSMVHMIEKWVKEGKGTKKWRKILVIAEEKMSLSRVAITLHTSIRERIKCEGKSIVRCSNKESKNQAQGFVIES